MVCLLVSHSIMPHHSDKKDRKVTAHTDDMPQLEKGHNSASEDSELSETEMVGAEDAGSASDNDAILLKLAADCMKTSSQQLQNKLGTTTNTDGKDSDAEEISFGQRPLVSPVL